MTSADDWAAPRPPATGPPIWLPAGWYEDGDIAPAIGPVAGGALLSGPAPPGAAARRERVDDLPQLLARAFVAPALPRPAPAVVPPPRPAWVGVGAIVAAATALTVADGLAMSRAGGHPAQLWLNLGAPLLGQVAAVALSAAVIARSRRWTLAGLFLTTAGTAILAVAPGLGALVRAGLGGPAGADLDLVRWLVTGALALVVAGWLGLSRALVAAGVLRRVDGLLLVAGVAAASAGAYQDVPVLVLIATLALLAAALGFARGTGDNRGRARR